MSRATIHLQKASRKRDRKGFALVSTLLLLALMIAVSAQLTTTVSVEAIVAGRRANDLAHELAVDSALIVLADQLRDPKNNALNSELDRQGHTRVESTLGGVIMKCSIQDDGAKFNPLRFSAAADKVKLERMLSSLTSRMHLPASSVQLRPIVDDTRTEKSQSAFRWFDQLFAEVQPGDLFAIGTREDYSNKTWSDVLTFWGDGRTDIRRVSPDVLEGTLEDVRPGLAKAILSRRKPPPATNVLEQALTVVDAEIRASVASRLTYDARRYAITIETSIGGDRRQWYVVATITEKQLVVHHRSQILW